MFPFYYGWLPDSKTAFVCLVAQVFPVVVSFESYNGEFNRKWALFNGPSVNPRPLYNGNMAKVSI